MIRLPILGYHNIGAADAGTAYRHLHVSTEEFERQMWLLKKIGKRGVSLTEAFDQIGKGCASERLVALTFDDGYLDNLHSAAPILRQFGFSATCYLVSDLIGMSNSWDSDRVKSVKPLMDVTQVRQWLDFGMEIGSHSRTHPNLTETTDDETLSEILLSREMLTKTFGAPIQHFCYPYGRYNEAAARAVRRVGYRTAVTQRRGFATSSCDPYCLPRITILGDQGLLAFMIKTLTPYEDIRGRHERSGDSGIAMTCSTKVMSQ